MEPLYVQECFLNYTGWFFLKKIVAERAGFEPAVPAKIHTLSKRAR